jgi:hypothetical protein
LDGIHGARKLGQHAVASSVRDPATMLAYESVHLLASSGEGAQGSGLVLADQA